MSKCRNGSKRWKKLQKRLQKWYNKRTNQLKDYIEKLTYQLVKKYDTIVFEKNYSAIKILIGGEQNMIFPLSRFIQRLKDKFQLYKPKADGVQFVKSKKHNPPKFHSKKKTQPSFRQTIRQDKKPVENNTVTLRIHGKIEFSTSVEYLDYIKQYPHQIQQHYCIF